MSKSIRVSVEVDVHSVTCPGVWFPCKSPVYMSICFLGFHVKTKPFPAAFPLLFGDKFVFEKTFPGKENVLSPPKTIFQKSCEMHCVIFNGVEQCSQLWARIFLFGKEEGQMTNKIRICQIFLWNTCNDVWVLD